MTHCKAACLLILASGLLCAQVPVPGPPPVVVTGSSEPVPLAEADRDVTATPLLAPQRLLFDSWFNLLALDPALDLRQRSPGGFLGDLSIRGATFGQTLVLLNGLRVNDAQTGHFNLDLPIPIEMITSLEVLKGAGSTLYGSDAIGGVVNIRTQPRDTPDLRLLGALGNFGSNEEHAVTAVRHQQAFEELAVSRDFSSGFTQNRDYRNLAFGSLSSLSTKRGATSLLLAYSDRPYGADQFYGNFASWERIKTWFAAVHHNLGEKTEASFAFRRHTDLFVLSRYHPEVYTNRHRLETWQGNLRRHNQLPLHAVISYGAEILGEAIESTNLGSRNRRRGSAYIFYDVRAFHRFGISAGIREEVDGWHRITSSPSLSGTAWLSSRFKLRASASHAFRLPSYTDLYYSDPANRGNANLKPESAISLEAALDARLNSRFRASATLFQRRDRNGIDYVRSQDNEIWQATNFDHLRFTGIEAAVNYELGTGQHIALTVSALQGSLPEAQVLQSKYAFSYPRHSGVVDWRAELANKVIARTRVGIVHRVGTAPYAVWDVSGAYVKGRVRPFLQLTNITSTVYQEISHVAVPPLGVLGGVELVVFSGRP